MGNYTTKFKHETEFDGDTVVTTMSRMKRADALKLAPYMEGAEPDEDGNVNLKMTFKDTLTMVEVAAEILPRYIHSLTGLIVDGEDVSIHSEIFEDIVMKDSYFTQLLSEWLGALVENSFVKDAKKSESPQESTSVE